MLSERVHRCGHHAAPGPRSSRLRPRLLPEAGAELRSRGRKACRRRRSRFGPQRLRQQPSQQLVTAFGQRQPKLPFGSPVQLGRPSGTRTRPPRQAAIDGLEKAGPDQPVEVERGQDPADSYGAGGLITRDLARLSGHVPVEGTPDRLSQQGQRLDLFVEFVLWQF